MPDTQKMVTLRLSERDAAAAKKWLDWTIAEWAENISNEILAGDYDTELEVLATALDIRIAALTGSLGPIPYNPPTPQRRTSRQNMPVPPAPTSPVQLLDGTMSDDWAKDVSWSGEPTDIWHGDMVQATSKLLPRKWWGVYMKVVRINDKTFSVIIQSPGPMQGQKGLVTKSAVSKLARVSLATAIMQKRVEQKKVDVSEALAALAEIRQDDDDDETPSPFTVVGQYKAETPIGPKPLPKTITESPRSVTPIPKRPRRIVRG